MKKQQKQLKSTQERELWNGFRPSVMPARKNNKRLMREENKQLCRQATKSGNTDNC